MNVTDISEADFAALLELAESRFHAWRLKELHPERDHRIGELKKQNLRSGGRAVSAMRIYRELLEREVRERIGFYAAVAHESRNPEMLSKSRLEEHRDRVMTTVGHATAGLKAQIERDARAAGDIPESALPHEQRYIQLKAEIFDVVNSELRVLEAEGKLARAHAVRDHQKRESVPSAVERVEAIPAGLGSPRRLAATIVSPNSARQMEAYMESRGIGQTEFAVEVGTTDRTLRTFRQTGKVRRDIFNAIAKAMGTTREALLKPE
jgi:hypothetical protein